MLRYAITDEMFQPGDGERWAAEGVDFVQLRAKTLEAGALLALARTVSGALQRWSASPANVPKLLINGRADVAIAAGADGVHLTAHCDELTPEQARRVFALAGAKAPVVSVSAHNRAEVELARDGGADLVLFGPVFEKRVRDEIVAHGTGHEALREACLAANGLPVLALGGVTEQNAAACLAAGAAGIAGIRMFASAKLS